MRHPEAPTFKRSLPVGTIVFPYATNELVGEIVAPEGNTLGYTYSYSFGNGHTPVYRVAIPGETEPRLAECSKVMLPHEWAEHAVERAKWNKEMAEEDRKSARGHDARAARLYAQAAKVLT